MGDLQIDAQAARREYSTVEASFTKTDLRMVRRLGEIMKRAPAGLVFALVLGLLSPLASAQTPPAVAPPADDAAMAAQKAAFLALPEATRKAAQEALVWLGFYVGVNDGEFGKRTRDAILAFQASVKAPADGALSPPLLNALLAAGSEGARARPEFQVVSDPKTGAKIGAPLKLLNARGGARLDFASNADADLGALYARLSAATPARKIAYKAIKPDAFFVVSGQDGPTKFYTRFDKNPAANPPIRGFTFAYPASQAAYLDRIAIAVANSFEPFPESAGARAATAPRRPPRRVAPPPPAAPAPAATALVIAPGKALTALKADDCPNPTVAGKPVRIERADAATGLAMLAGDFASNGGAPRLGAPAQDLVILGFSGPRLAASSASFAGDEARPIVTAAVDKSAGGGPAFDRRGALVGLVAPIAGEPKRVAGVALAAPHALIAPDALRAFLGDGEPSSERARPAQRGRHRRAREEGAGRGLLPEIARGRSLSAGSSPGKTYCCSATSTPRISVRMMLCQKVRANTTPSCPRRSVTETPVAMFCGEIILPITPPDELVAANSTGLRSSCFAATTCRLPNSALPEVSLPDRHTATQPRKGERRTNKCPTEATPRPSV